MKIAFFDAKSYDKISFERYAAIYGIRIKYYETKLNEDTAELAKGCDGVCAFVNDTVSSEVIDRLALYGVKFIVMRCAGYNNVDLKRAEGKIRVARVPAYSPYAIAEHAMAMLLCSVRKIHKAFIRTKDFNFNLDGLTGFDLHGKTVGVIGTGKIGRAFIDICRGFGMRILAYDIIRSCHDTAEYVEMDKLLSESDIISLHCPLTEETRYMINESAILKMKDGAIIINTSRGALIDTEALVDGIRKRKIGGACLDVYEEEAEVFYNDLSSTIVNDDKLLRLISMPNVIVTSHQAYLTREALDSIAKTTLENSVRLASNGDCENEIFFQG